MRFFEKMFETIFNANSFFRFSSILGRNKSSSNNMMHPRLNVPLSQENPLWISWHDTAWIAILNPTNVMDYFMEKSNPFYDRTCNNEIVKMQRQSFEHLKYAMHETFMLTCFSTFFRDYAFSMVFVSQHNFGIVLIFAAIWLAWNIFCCMFKIQFYM